MALHVMTPTLLNEDVKGILEVGFASGGKWRYAGGLWQREGDGAVEKIPVVVSLVAAMAMIRGYGR